VGASFAFAADDLPASVAGAGIWDGVNDAHSLQSKMFK
jgi:hypothetical protein